MKTIEKSFTRVVTFDDGTQSILHGSGIVSGFTVIPDDKKVVSEQIVNDLTIDVLEVLSGKVKTSHIKFDTISGEITVTSNDTMKEKTLPNQPDIKSKDII